MKRVSFFEEAMVKYNEIEKMERGQERDDAFETFYDSFGAWEYELFNKYHDATIRNNSLIDFDNLPEKTEIPVLVDVLKKRDVKHITVSSGWSSMIERMWILCQNGCVVEGMTEINGRHKDWKTGEYYKEPAFLVKIGE